MSIALIIMSISIIVFLGAIVLYVCKAINAFANGIESISSGLGDIYNKSSDSIKDAIADSGNSINQVIDAYVPMLDNAAEKIANMKGTITITFGDDKKTDNDENIKYGDF